MKQLSRPSGKKTFFGQRPLSRPKAKCKKCEKTLGQVGGEGVTEIYAKDRMKWRRDVGEKWRRGYENLSSQNISKAKHNQI